MKTISALTSPSYVYLERSTSYGTDYCHYEILSQTKSLLVVGITREAKELRREKNEVAKALTDWVTAHRSGGGNHFHDDEDYDRAKRALTILLA